MAMTLFVRGHLKSAALMHVGHPLTNKAAAAATPIASLPYLTICISPFLVATSNGQWMGWHLHPPDTQTS